jgi:hypothetical protein
MSSVPEQSKRNFLRQFALIVTQGQRLIGWSKLELMLNVALE